MFEQKRDGNGCEYGDNNG
uniref:Uncharacterized protein n=1 Tax=Rhizophora mucronata TaxID=61149 RepID=A0A2P2J8N0_RHIMU